MSDSLMNTYARLPVAFDSGKGAWLTDTQGNQHLDLLTGVAVCTLGHAHPKVSEAICEQARTLIHTSNWYRITKQEALADRLTALSGMDNVFFSNSGAEANEAAIKLARLHGHAKGIASPSIIVADQSFHGRTMATLTATGNRKVHKGFEPLVSGFIRVPFADAQAIQSLADNRKDISAILVEPIQGEGGVHVPPEGYLQTLRTICDANDWLLILDEIQTGIGRTGYWFAHQHEQVKPDVMTLAKALGNGMPIGACLAAGKAATLFQPGHHGSTFGGSPLACAAALAVLDSFADGLIDRAKAIGERLSKGLHDALQGVEGVREIRGRGLIWGIDLDRPCFDLVQRGLDQKLLINVTGGSVVRLLPPVVLSDDEIDLAVRKVSQLIIDFLQETDA